MIKIIILVIITSIGEEDLKKHIHTIICSRKKMAKRTWMDATISLVSRFMLLLF